MSNPHPDVTLPINASDKVILLLMTKWAHIKGAANIANEKVDVLIVGALQC